MNNQKRITKIITSIILAVLVFLNLNLNYNVKNVNAKDNSKNVETTSNDEISSKEVSKVSSPDEGSIKESNGKKYVDNDVLLFFKDGVTKEKVNEVVNYVNGSIIGEITTLNEYQVQVKESTLEELNNIVQDIMNKYSNYIAYASVDYISENSSIEPSDPWGNNSNWNESDVSGENWGLKAIDAQSAWQYNNIFDESVNKVNVGIVDGGFDTNGEDFPDNYEKYCDSDINLPYDHGTFVTGIIAAKANNNKGITGIVWNPGKVYLASATDSDYGYLTLSGLTKGVTDVLSNGANVVNCSFSGGEKTESTVAAIIMAKMISLGHDFVIIQASGNASVDASYSSWFAGIDDTELKIASNLYGVNVNDIKDRIIIAGAAELHDDGSYMQAEYSNGGDKVNICAPGSNIFSSKAGNNYVTGDGTSYAAPHVAGVVELTWRANPNLTGAEVRNIVCNYENTTYDVPDNPNSSDTRGDYRMVNAKLSVESALKTRSDLVTIYYNSDSDCNIKYKLSSDASKSKTELMNDNLDDNGYKKSITVPLDKSSYLLAEFGKEGNWDNNSGNYYKLSQGAYEIDNGIITKVNDKFQELKIFTFKADEGDVTSLGDNVVLSVKAKDAVGDVQYSYSVVDSEGNETLIKDYSSSSSVTWYAKKTGDYKFIAKIKDSRGYEVSKEKTFKVIAAPVVNSYSINPKTYGLVGESVGIYAYISGGKGTSRCRFLAQGGNYQYGDKEIYFNMESYISGSWTPDMDGTYRIYCDITDESGTTHRHFLCNYEIKKDTSYSLDINSLNANKTSNIEIGEDILLNFSYTSGYDPDGFEYTTIYAMNEDGSIEKIDNAFYYPNKLNSVKWAPTKSGKWTITVTIKDSHKDVTSKSLVLNVNEYKKVTTSNTTTIYYKGYDTPYIHYGVNNANWTKVPGVQMTATNEKAGYTHKYVINLDSYDNVSVCFNNGNGNWDSNNGKNYTFNSGVYTYSNGVSTKIGNSTSNFAISYLRGNYEGTRTVDTATVLRAETVNASGNVTYTFKSVDDKGNEKVFYTGSNNEVTWTPDESGKYKVFVTAIDSDGNSDTKAIDYIINPKVEITSFTIDKESPVLINTPLSIHAEAKGGTGKYSYSFYIKYSESSYCSIGDDTDTCTWTPTFTGTFSIGVTIRDESNYSVSYDIPYQVFYTQINPLYIYSIYSTDANIVTNKECNIVASMYSSGEGALTYNAYALNSDGTKEIIAKNANSNQFKWKPSKSGDWMVFVTVTDEKGQKDYCQNNFKVVDKVENYTTIYYNGYENTNIHYKVGDGNWTSAPGIPMEKTDEILGYTHKITIPLGDAEKVICCFNDGKGTWDNNNSNDYTLGVGDYFISDQTITKVTIPTSLLISSAKLSSGEINLGESINVTTKIMANKGNCNYTIFAINQDTGSFAEISKEKSDSNVSWKPNEKGTWYVYILAQDDSCASDGVTLGVTVK